MKSLADYEAALSDYLRGTLAPASGVRYVVLWLCHYRHAPDEEHLRVLSFDEPDGLTWATRYAETETDALVVEHRAKDCRKDVEERLRAAYGAQEESPDPAS